MSYLDNLVESNVKAQAAHEEAARLDKWLSEDALIFLQEISSCIFRPYDTDHFAAEALNEQLENILADVSDVVAKLQAKDLANVYTIVKVSDDGISLWFDYADDGSDELVVPFELMQRIDSRLLM